MAEMNVRKAHRHMRLRHRGRGSQVWIYLGKLLRMFVYQNDWKVLPMAALIAGLVGMVVRKRFFINMEGSIMGAFAMVCVCIWNGCFNSIQVICRERDVIKREHRSGMHISSYVCAHMIYQAMLCAAQTVVTLYVTRQVGVKYPAEGFITQWMLLDLGISMFLITYASDLLSLWVSTLARTTTTAMTIMPFVLIFQLVFSGGMLTLPGWTEALTPFTISNPGLKVLCAQADVNNQPFVTISDMIDKMRDSEIGGEVSLGQALDLLTDAENPSVAKLRAVTLGRVMTVGELMESLNTSESFAQLRNEAVLGDRTVGDVLDAIDAAGILDKYRDVALGGTITVGEAVDWLAANPDVQAHRDQTFTVKTTLGNVLNLVGEDNVKSFLNDKAAAANYKPEYERSLDNIISYWFHLFMFILAFGILSTITLEFIDKDKR